MSNFSTDDTTKPLVEPDAKFGSFESDPNDQFIQRYIPSADELARIESWLREEIDRAWDDDQPSRNKKLDLLNAYHARPEGQSQILTLPYVKRAVNQNVAWVVNSIMGKKPLVTVAPDGAGKITVLVPDPDFGAIPMDKSSEEVAQALEAWLEYKLRKKLDFRRVVETACLEAKRGQTPTWIAIRHKKESRKVRAPKFESTGPIGVTFQTKDELDIQVGQATRLENVSTYSMLMPLDEQDPQQSRWVAERCTQSNEEMRRMFYNGDYFLCADKKDWEELIAQDGDNEIHPDEQKKASIENRMPSIPKGRHDVWQVWFFWTVPFKQTLVLIDGETGEQKTKNQKIYQEYSFVGYWHKKAGKLLSMTRNPFDHGLRPYIPVFDRKEPFRHTGGSIAEDVLPYQKVNSQLNSLEIRGGVLATTPVIYAEPGSAAGEWVANNQVEPGSIVPRLKEGEIELATMGERPQSLLGLIQFHQGQFEKDVPNSSDLQIGLEVPGRTPASTMMQIMNAGETQAALFLDSFRSDLAAAIKLYIQTVQQYMRFGEVIPFDPETKATIQAALEAYGDKGDQPMAPDAMPMRFPMAPINDQFDFFISASSDDRTQQADFEKRIALKKVVDADGAKWAQAIGPMMQLVTAVAEGRAPQSLLDIIMSDLKRDSKLMEQIAKAMRADGADFAIPSKLLDALVREQKQITQIQAQQAAMQQGAPNAIGPQGTPPQPGGGMPPIPNGPGGMGQPVPQPSVPPVPVGNQGGGPQSQAIH